MTPLHYGVGQIHYPAKQQLMRFQSSPSGIVRRLAGRYIATALVACSFTGSLSAHAEPVAAEPAYAVAMALEAGGEKSAPRVLAKAGKQFAVASGARRVEMTVRQAKTPTKVWLAGQVFNG